MQNTMGNVQVHDMGEEGERTQEFVKCTPVKSATEHDMVVRLTAARYVPCVCNECYLLRTVLNE